MTSDEFSTAELVAIALALEEEEKKLPKENMLYIH